MQNITKKTIIFKILFIVIILVLVLSLFPAITNAVDLSSETKFVKGIASPPDTAKIIGRAVKLLLGIAGSVALLMFVFGGFTIITSGGADEKINKGKQTLIWAAIGLVFILSSYMAVSFVISTLKGGITTDGKCDIVDTCFSISDCEPDDLATCKQNVTDNDPSNIFYDPVSDKDGDVCDGFCASSI